MNDAFQIAGIALGSQQRALDVLAGNIANMNTPAYKRSDVHFSEMLAHGSDPLTPSAGLSDGPQASGVMVRTTTAFDETGEIKHTGHAMDLAIDGNGFIELMGPRGQTLLWRGGTLTTLEDGLLATQDGLALRALINVPKEATDIRIDSSGSVTALLGDTDQRTQLGEIEIVSVLDGATVEPLDGGLYAIGAEDRLTRNPAGENGAGNLVQGAIEQSNVRLNDEMVRLMIVQRSYAANAQVVQAADQLASITNGLRR